MPGYSLAHYHSSFEPAFDHTNNIKMMPLGGLPIEELQQIGSTR